MNGGWTNCARGNRRPTDAQRVGQAAGVGGGRAQLGLHRPLAGSPCLLRRRAQEPVRPALRRHRPQSTRPGPLPRPRRARDGLIIGPAFY